MSISYIIYLLKFPIKNRLFLIVPEIAMNVMGTIWAFFNVVTCINENDTFANTVVEGEKQNELCTLKTNNLLSHC
jgi:hypothetical protein